MTPTAGSLCSGVDGLALGVERALGVRTVWQSEIDPHASVVLAARWPGVPNLGDLRADDWAQVEPVDLMCFGFPCQDISSAGRRAGLEGERSGLWFDCADAVRVVRPRYLLVENVSALLTRGLDRVVADLAQMGYVGRWGCLRSSDVGAPHRRERVFVAAALTDGERARRHPGSVPRRGPVESRPDMEHNGLQPAFAGPATPNAYSPSRTPGDAEPGDGATPHVRGGTPRPGGRHRLTPDADGNGLGFVGGHQQSAGSGARPNTDGRLGAWGDFGPAIHRWEAVHGPAPAPRDDRGRLNPELPEWMLGFPPGWVTDPALGLPRTAQLRLIGNAVQPQIAELAARLLLVPLMAESEAA